MILFMKKIAICLFIILGMLTGKTQTNRTLKSFEKDTIQTANGKLVITFVGHGSLMLETGNRVVHVDPVSMYANYALFPKGDLILITHHHDDHLDSKAVALVSQPQTKIVIGSSCLGKVVDGIVLKNGEEQTFGDFNVKAVPAYNILNQRNGIPYHTKGEVNGYVITYDGLRIYIAGDTENIPEMADLKQIDIAFLPMNLPFTMTPKMVADGALSFMPKILYPYHMGETNPQLLIDLLKESKIEVRVRKMK